jgi:hypothetical protein
MLLVALTWVHTLGCIHMGALTRLHFLGCIHSVAFTWMHSHGCIHLVHSLGALLGTFTLMYSLLSLEEEKAFLVMDGPKYVRTDGHG